MKNSLVIRLCLGIMTLLLGSFALDASAQIVKSRKCPFTCRGEGHDAQHCHEWRKGNMCYIELVSVNQNRAPAQNQAPQQQYQPPAPAANGCDDSSTYIKRPRIEIGDTRASGNVFKNDVKVRGAVEGTCLTEAGYYENGTLRETIPVSKDPAFHRFEFEIKARADSSRRPEIRVYNVRGDRDEYEIDTD